MMIKRKIYAVIMCFMLCWGLTGLASAENANEPYIISIDGFGEVTAIPDRAKVSISIVNSAKKAKEAQQENAVIANAVKAALQGLGIADKDMKTSNYNFRPVYSQEKNKTNKIISYSASCTMDVVVNDIDKTGLVIDRALQNGANKVNNVSFDLKEPEIYRKAALRAALQDAKAKAEVIAQELGVNIKGVKLVTENVGSVTPKGNLMLAKMAGNGTMDGAAADREALPTPIEVGDIEVDAAVHVDYVIE